MHPLSKGENDLADMRAAFHQPARFGHLLQCKAGRNHRPDIPLLDPGSIVFTKPLGDARLFRGASGTQLGAGEDQTLEMNRHHIDLDPSTERPTGTGRPWPAGTAT